MNKDNKNVDKCNDFEMIIPLVKLDTTKDHIKKNDISIIKAFNFHKNECP